MPSISERIQRAEGKFFEGLKLQLWQIIAPTYFWSLGCGRTRGLSQKQVLKELEIKSEHTMVDCNSAAMSMLSTSFNNPQQIERPGR